MQQLDVSESVEEDDLTWEVQGVKFVVDEMSLQFLSGTTIDYSNSLNDGGFKFSNPNSKRSCGCRK